MRPRVILFAKAPLPGFAKTRLVPALGEAGAAALANSLLVHVIGEATAAFPGAVELCVTPSPEDPAWDNPDFRRGHVSWTAQGNGDLGARMARAAKRALAGGEPVLLMGSDCPDLDRHVLVEASRRLENADAVMVPALDGGYVLFGLRRFDPSVFSSIAWSTDEVARVTAERCAALGWKVDRMAALSDIDEPRDLHRLPPRFLPANCKDSLACPTNPRPLRYGVSYDARNRPGLLRQDAEGHR